MSEDDRDSMPEAAIPVSPFKWRTSYQWDWLGA